MLFKPILLCVIRYNATIFSINLYSRKCLIESESNDLLITV